MRTEPVIITDMSNEELAQWVCARADYILRLEALNEERALQLAALEKTTALIDKYTKLCVMQIKVQ